jgi:4-amino-4-deoxy-L-arabinose transferase-like glycosyltransferase
VSSEATGGDTATPRHWPPSVRGTSAARIAEFCIVAIALAGFVAYVSPTLDAPLLEEHAFRQTQTAWTARVFHEDGIDLLHPKLPVFGEPFEAPFEFPLFQALATVPMAAGVAEDTALRLTCLACFLLTALLLWALVRHVAGAVSGVVAVIAFTFTPFALVWSRTSMIEYLATAGAVGFALGIALWRERRHPALFAAALGAGLVGMLVKPTTAAFWMLPALAYRPPTVPRGSGTRRVDPWLAALVAVPFLAAAAWTRHADAIKAASPVTDWLTSSNLQRWNFGWTTQRFDPSAWHAILQHTVPNLLSLYTLLLVPAAIAGWRSTQRLFWLAVASAAVLPPLVFMNLYVNHDYYPAAISPAIAALVGLGGGWVWSVVRPRWLVAALPLAALLLAWGTLELGRGYWLRIHGGYDDPQVMPLAREIDAHTASADLVGTVGLDWSPAVLYYAHRRGNMVTGHARDAGLDAIHDDGYRYLLVASPDREDLGLLDRWAWVGVLGPHLYGLGDVASQVAAPDLLATNPGRKLAASLGRAAPVPGAPGTLKCSVGTRVRAGTSGTWLLFADASPGARLSVDDLAPVPARRAVFVSPALAEEGTVVVSCEGRDELALLRVVDAPAPR